MDPDDAMDVKRGDEAIDQGLAHQLEQCRYALLQRDEQLRKALKELSDERQQSADMCNQRAELKQQLHEAVELLLKSSPRDFSDAAARLQWVQRRDAFLGRQKGGKS